LLEAAAPATENQVDNHNRKKKTETATAVVSDARSHVKAAATNQQQNDDENHYQWHVPESSIRTPKQV
jgi:hypothetical protein